MTAKENLILIKNTLAEINDIKGDDEAAHSQEDDLWEAVLEDVASGKWTAKECQQFAREALKTKKIEFKRWCA